MSSSLGTMLLQAASAFYVMSMIGYIHFLFGQKERSQKVSFGLMAVAVLLHLVSVAMVTASSGHLPVQNLPDNLSIAALALGGMFIVFQYRAKLKILGVFASILLAGAMLLIWVVPDTPPQQNEVFKGFWFYSHIALVFCGEAALALSCGAGILYLLQEKGIKTKKPGFFFKRLPSLDFLDNAGYTFLTTGFALLTIGLVAGFMYARVIWGRFWSWDLKEVFSVGSWLVYAALLHLRLYSGWRGRRSAIMTIVGFVIILFTFLGVNMLLGGHHQGFTK